VPPFISLVENQHTVLFPVTDHPADVLSILEPALDAVYISSRDASSPTQVSEEINALFDRPE
jgi:multiple sugar transport system substrate-binding protein